MKSTLGDLRRQVDLVLKAEIRRQRDVFGEWKADGIVEELQGSVFPGGKRLRPVLCCLGYQAAGGRISRKILKVAASLELLHTFAVIHDDIMDASPSRRGASSAYRRAAARFHGGRGMNEPQRLGMSLAVLTGDFALVLSDGLFTGSGFPASELERAWEPLQRLRMEAIGGQYLDLTTRGGPGTAPESALRVAALKTAGYSVKGPLLVGAALANAGPEASGALSEFGAKAGVAFQLTDDLAGLLGDPAATGKDAETDARRGSPTWLIARTMGMASTQQKKVLMHIWGNPDCTAVQLEELRGLVQATGAASDAVGRIKAMVDEAAAALKDGGLRKGPVTELAGIANSIGRAAEALI